MIAYLKGDVISVSEDNVIIDVNSIGYNVKISARTVSQLPGIGMEVKIYTYMNVREDDISLFGFLDKEQLELFKLLISVSGIGPKGALAILSGMDDIELKYAIIAGNDKLIAKSPGIGIKTAQRLILELKSKISVPDLESDDDTFDGENVSAMDISKITVRDEVMQALMMLGYSAGEASKAFQQVAITPDITSEELLKLVLKKMI